jgi:hypothetical protein
MPYMSRFDCGFAGMATVASLSEKRIAPETRFYDKLVKDCVSALKRGETAICFTLEQKNAVSCRIGFAETTCGGTFVLRPLRSGK